MTEERPSLGLSVVSNWTLLLVKIVVAFFLTPYLIHYLGKERYGIWTLAYSFLVYYVFFRLGVGAGLMRYVPLYLGRGDKKNINESVSTGVVVALVVAFVIIGISVLAAERISYFLKAGPEIAVLIRIFGAIGAAQTLILVFDSATKAHERWVIANIRAIAVQIFYALGLVGCIYFGYGLVAMGY